ncbi:MAG: hypothetical protein Q8Q12_03520 [bacterium]|nr:hypothetical protein [bacterium]
MQFPASRAVVALLSVIQIAYLLNGFAEIKTVYVVVPTHLDIGFTAPPDAVARGYKDGIDHAIQLCETYPDYFYTIECAWQLREWMNRSSPGEIEKLSGLVKSGRIEIGGAFATMHSELMSGESVNRMFDLGLSLTKKLGGEIRTAIQDDVPGYAWAYPQAMRQHGIKYFLTGINTSFGGKPDLTYKDIPFYWEGADGSRVLTWIAFGGYADGNDWGVGLWEKEDTVFEKVQRQAREIEKAGYPYDAFLIMASPGDNVDASATEKIHRIIGKWNATEKGPVLKMATPRQFFEYMEEKYGDRFPTYRGDWSGHWVPAKLGAPRLIARMRYAQRILPVAEALWSVLALSGAARFPSEDIASAWDDLLTISEHTAAAGTGWPNLTTKEQVIWENWQHAYRGLFASYSSSMLLDEGMEVLANSITADYPFIVVFNSIPRTRAGYVEVNMPPEVLQRGFTIIEDVLGGGHREVEYDLLEDGRTIRFSAGVSFGMGYSVYRVAPGPVPTPIQASEGDTLESPRLVVSVDPETGYIKSICDKTLKREWVEKGRLFGALHLVRPAQAMMGRTSQPAQARASRIELIEGKTYKTLRVLRDKGALVQTSVTVSEPRLTLKIENVLDTSKIPAEDRVVALLEFPFNLDAEWLKVALDGPNHYRWWPDDYLPGTARIGQTVQSYALLHDEKANVSFMPVEAPILSLGKVGLHSLDKPRKARIYSYLYDRAFWGENRDTGRTRYDEVEPALGTKISFTYYLDFGPSPKPERAAGGWPRPRALEATAPLFGRFHSPWGKQEGKLGDATAKVFLMAPFPSIELSSATVVSQDDETFWQLRFQENWGDVSYPYPRKVNLLFPVGSVSALDPATGEPTPVSAIFGLRLPDSAFKTATFLIRPESETPFAKGARTRLSKDPPTVPPSPTP